MSGSCSRENGKVTPLFLSDTSPGLSDSLPAGAALWRGRNKATGNIHLPF